MAQHVVQDLFWNFGAGWFGVLDLGSYLHHISGCKASSCMSFRLWAEHSASSFSVRGEVL